MNSQNLGLKTWSALLGTKKRPSEYEIVTCNLHYRARNPQAPYELDPDVMMNRWYKQYVVRSPLQHGDWNRFRDPDQLTYRAYMTTQDGSEEYVDGLLKEHAARGHDQHLDQEWVKVLARCYTPARYMQAALQMACAYVVQMAPASTITNCAAFQEADAVRWLSRIAYRTRELANAHPSCGFIDAERGFWEDDPVWQGVRELMERLLTTYDWGENLIVLNTVATRALEEACVRQLARAARLYGDTLTSMLLEVQWRDCERSRRWTSKYVELALEQPANKTVIAGWISKWVPLADRAIDAFCAALPPILDAGAQAKADSAEFRHQFDVSEQPLQKGG
jgi:toluene monooxygenase system protein E